MGSGDETLVVANQPLEVVSKIKGSRYVKRIKESQDRWVKPASLVADRRSHHYEGHRLERGARLHKAIGSGATNRSDQLSPNEITRDQIPVFLGEP